MGSKHRLIGVAPLGQVPEITLKVIAAHVSNNFNLFTQILPPLESPEYAFDARRYQYDAGIIIKSIGVHEL